MKIFLGKILTILNKISKAKTICHFKGSRARAALLQSRARIERVFTGSPIVRSLEILKIGN